MEEIIETISGELEALKEDKPYLIITDEIIKEYIECYVESAMKDMVKQIKENL